MTSILHGAATAADAPTLGGAAPTLVVTASVEDLDGGVCRADGIEVALPARVAHRTACTGSVQKIVYDTAGRIIQLGTKERLFSPHQRRAIASRDGGCIIRDARFRRRSVRCITSPNTHVVARRIPITGCFCVGIITTGWTPAGGRFR
ncbi:hypothetical protein ACFOEP_13330 [Microbacterium amylolyticum]|uniref:hypothetical protein n=1 Tax=Microbacterium amylolyticum TaxID=936337 RepID=UPI00360A10BD